MGLAQDLNNQSLNLSNNLFSLGNSAVPQLGVGSSLRGNAGPASADSSNDSSDGESSFAKGGIVKAPGTSASEITIPVYVVKYYGADVFQRLIDSVPKRGIGAYDHRSKKNR